MVSRFAMPEEWKGPTEQLDPFAYLIPKSYKPSMRTDGLIFADAKMMDQVRKDFAPEQVANVATMPGIVGRSMAMPDIHWGYGFPIGGVAAFDYDEGIFSPGGTGFDVLCGVRLLRTDLTEKDVRPRLKDLVDTCFKNVPSGVGEGGPLKVERKDFEDLAETGVKWAVGKGYAWSEDPVNIETNGCLPDADFSKVSERAIARGKDQLGCVWCGGESCVIQEDEVLPDSSFLRTFFF